MLERYGEVPDGLLSGEIGASWNRCLQAGLDPMRAPTPVGVGGAARRAARERHERARRLARVEMEALHGQIAGSNFLIAFAGPDDAALGTRQLHTRSRRCGGGAGTATCASCATC